MNNSKLSWKKYLLNNILSLGFLILGIGCISWAAYGILGQPNYAAEANSFNYQNHPISSVQPKSLTSVQPKSLSSIQPISSEVAYSEIPKTGEKIGSLTIPAIKLKLPIYEGTSSKQLDKGVGHFIQSVLPGEVDNCVLSGHRTSVFSKLGMLKKDDQLIVRTSAGEFVYNIKRIRIVDKDDKTVIVPTENGVLTLSTCYPFRYIGSAPKRYIISADLVGNGVERGEIINAEY